MAASFEDSDTTSLAEKLGAGQDVPSNYVSRLDRLHNELEHGLGWDMGRDDARLSLQETSVQDGVRQLAFRINALALRVTSLETFQQRAGEMFQVLSAFAAS